MHPSLQVGCSRGRARAKEDRGPAALCTWQVLKAQRRKTSNRRLLCREGLHMPQALGKEGGELPPSPPCMGNTGSTSAGCFGCNDTQYVGGLGIQ